MGKLIKNKNKNKMADERADEKAQVMELIKNKMMKWDDIKNKIRGVIRKK